MAIENFESQLAGKKFSSPQEELEFLRGEVLRREKEMSEKGVSTEREKVISDQLKSYAATPVESVLHQNVPAPKAESEAVVLNLSPEEHDEKMSELITILREHGLRHALNVVDKTDDHHLYDDFHRFLVQYVKAGFTIVDLKEKTPEAQALKMVLFEVIFPQMTDEEEKNKKISEIISGMEQFYAGMSSLVSNDHQNEAKYMVLEVANPTDTEELVFYASVPQSLAIMFEKQVLSIFPGARLIEQNNDYNIFNTRGVSLASNVSLEKEHIYSIKTYDTFEHDPLSVLINTFSKIKKEGQGAAFQIVFRPCSDKYTKLYQEALNEVAKGTKLKEAIKFETSILSVWGGMIKDGASMVAKEITKIGEGPKEEKKDVVDEDIIKSFRTKAGSPTVETNIRLVVSAEDEANAKSILSDIQSSFNQFENTFGNKFKFAKMSPAETDECLNDYSFRLFDEKNIIPLNIKELSTVLHWPRFSRDATPFLKQNKAITAPAPMDIGMEGVLLGVNKFRGVSKDIHFAKEDRLRHLYTIGQTGTGKTTIMLNMIAQDIKNGDGVCMIDPHGSDIQTVLSTIPKERYEDVIYFDPAYTDRPMALNMLEYDVRFPEQKTFVVNEMLSIFNKLFDMKTAGGPMFEQYFRNAVMLVIEDPESGNTLLDVSRVMANKAFRELKLNRCKNPIVVQFWREVAEKAGGEASLANIVPYITSKFDVFLSNEIMRPIIAQERSTFNFREIMDKKKILLVNLSKGRLGDINSNLVGLIIVGKFLMAALSRVDSFGKDMPPFYLYIDEFQNITTDSISQILSEARKYKLSLNIAHQFIGQLPDNIKDAVFGNVGSIAAFRVGSEDAEFLEKQFAPTFSAKDIMNIDNFNAYIRMLSHGRPTTPFSMEAMPPPKGDKAIVDKLKELSYLKYGGDRAEVEEAIMKKYRKEPVIEEDDLLL
jgi:hypothetical protein